MNIFVLSVALVGIVLSVVCKIYGFSMFYPSLIIILAVILNTIDGILDSKSEKKNKVNVEMEKERVKDIKNK